MSFTPDIIEVKDYVEIGTRLGLGVDSDDELDAPLIEQNQYLPYVEAKIKKIITNWAAIKAANGNDYIFLKRAVVCLAAAEILSARIGSSGNLELKSEKIGDYSYTKWDPSKMKEKYQEFIDCYAQALNSITGYTGGASHFRLWGPQKHEEQNDS